MKHRARPSARRDVLAGLDRQRPHQPEAAFDIGKGRGVPRALMRTALQRGQARAMPVRQTPILGAFSPVGPATASRHLCGGMRRSGASPLMEPASLPKGVGDPIKRRPRQAALAVGGCVGDNRSGASRIVSRDLRGAGKARLVRRQAAQRRHGLKPDEQHDDKSRDRPGRENTAPVTEILIPTLLFACLLHAL